jgi:ubiquinone/menaquinone biosynthesis C-methylase UbiE
MQSKFSKQELNDIIQWDVKSWKNALPFWDAHFAIKPQMKVLALGEREGGLSFYFAKLGCHVVCSDYNEMPAETKLMHEKYQVASQISYQQVDMRAIPFEDNSFDIVTFKSVIGALGNVEDQNKAIAEIYRVLKPGGALLMAENAVGSALHRKLRTKYVNWANRWRYISKTDIQNWSKMFATVNTKMAGFSALFGRSEKQRSGLAAMDKVFAPITPKKWKYIYYGVFVK